MANIGSASFRWCNPATPYLKWSTASLAQTGHRGAKGRRGSKDTSQARAQGEIVGNRMPIPKGPGKERTAMQMTDEQRSECGHFLTLPPDTTSA